MTDGKNIKSSKESKLIKTSLDGLVRLEFYPDRGYVVTIQVAKDKFFFMEIETMNELLNDYNEIIRLKGGKVKK